MPNPDSAARGDALTENRHRDWLPLFAFVVAASWSLWLYTPWSQSYLDRADFNEFLPFLKRGRTILEGFQLTSGYYWSQGRFFPLTVAFNAAKWSAFGTWAAGWQWTTQVLMLGNVVALYHTARRFGASKTGSSIGSALMIVGTSAVESWCRVHFSEAEGTLFFLGSVYFAAGARLHPSRRNDWATAGLLACAILTKETFVAVVPFVVLVQLCYRGGGNWDRPRRGGRELKSAIIAAVVAAVAIVPAIIARLESSPHAYAVRYGRFRVNPAVLAGQIHNIFLPTGSRLHEPLADLLILAVIIAGWVIGARGRASNRSVLIGILVLLALPLSGFLIYLPWPQWAPFYALPFLPAVAVLLALGFSFLMKSSNTLGKAAAAIALLIAAVDLSASAAHQSSDIYARRQVVGENVAALADYVSHNKVSEIIVPEDISGTAVSLQRYANATHAVQFPVFQPAGCDETTRVDSDALILRFSYLCRNRPVTAGDEIHFSRSAYRWLDFPRMRVDSDEYSAGFFKARSSTEPSAQ